MMTNSKLLCNIFLLTMLGELSPVTREMITCTTNCLVIVFQVMYSKQYRSVDYTGGTRDKYNSRSQELCLTIIMINQNVPPLI